jgi:DNA topoisomerase-2
MWVWDKSEGGMVYKTIEFPPGLFKIFDEILVNAADNYQREPRAKYIKVEIDTENGVIQVQNDGKGMFV